MQAERKTLIDTNTHYCPGCGHGVAHKLVAEAIDELGIRDRIAGIAPVGCAVMAYDYFDFDMTEAPHGRGPSIATGIKRVRPDLIVFTYQGDGDLAAIGMSEVIHTANRNENICIFFVNNAVYGMTGGQMAPTTLEGQKTSTCRIGRYPENDGHPVKMAELIASLDAPHYVERVSLGSAQHIAAAKKAVVRAFRNQMDGKGFSFVEMLSACPTYWDMSPVNAAQWIEQDMASYYPLGIKKVGV